MTTAARSTKVVAIEIVDPTTIALRIVGEFDALSVSDAAPALMRFKQSSPRHLLIDATEATFLDSTGIAALAMAAESVRRHGGQVTALASPTAARLIEVCGLSDLLGYAPAN